MWHRLNAARSIFVALFATCLAACNVNLCPEGPSVPDVDLKIDVNVHIDDGFSSRERTNIIKGVTMWERVAEGRLDWRINDTVSVEHPVDDVNTMLRSVVFLKAKSSDEWVKQWDEAKKPIVLLGFCENIVDPRIPSIVRLWLVEDRLQGNHEEAIIAAHEFGHALGLHHVDDNKSVMSTFLNKEIRCISKHDVNEFCDVFGCRTGKRMQPPCTNDRWPEITL